MLPLLPQWQSWIDTSLAQLVDKNLLRTLRPTLPVNSSTQVWHGAAAQLCGASLRCL